MRILESGKVFEQADYRVLLREAYARRKARKRGFSYAVWARELEVRSPSTLIMILNGTRHPGPELARRLAQNLGLSPVEGEHFKDLVELQRLRGRDVRSSVLLMEKVRRRQPREDFRFVDYQAFEAMSGWYYAALRELVSLAGFQEDPFWICGKLAFKVTPKQITQAIRVLLDLGLLERDEQGRLRGTAANLNTGQDIANAAIRRHHEEVLENAKLALARQAPAVREFCSVQFATRAELVPAAKEWIRRFQEQFCDEFEQRAGDALYQLHLNFYPLTRPEEKP